MTKKKSATPESTADILTPQSLLELNPEQAERAFNSFPPDDRQRLVLATPWEKRRTIIMLDRDARALVQSLPPEELYWTVLRTGVGDSLQLITLTNHEQLQFFFDMECWQKDRLRAPEITQWYKMLSKCNELRVIEWFMQADEEFLVGSFKKMMRVVKMQQDTDISEEYDDMPSATLDGVYFFVFFENDTYGFLMSLLNTLYQHDRDRFYSLAEGMLWDSDAETEEAAYYSKSRRLSEYGFPEFEESLNIYQLLSDQELEILSHAAAPAGTEVKKTALQPRFSLTGDDMPRFYMAVLQQIDDAELFERVQRQTITIANKIIVADALDVQSGDDSRRALKKAAGAVAIALESASGGDMSRALEIIRATDGEKLFRAGSTLIMKAARACRTPAWRLPDKALLETFMPTPWGETLHGFFQSRPLLFEGLVQPGATQYRAFMDLAELDLAAGAVADCRELERFLFELLGLDPDRLYGEILPNTTLDEPSQITADAVLLTVFSSVVLHGAVQLEPLSTVEALRYIGACFSPDAKGVFHLQKQIRKKFFDWAASFYEGGLSIRLNRYLETLIAAFDAVFSPIAAQKTIEKRYIDKLLFKRNE